MMNFHGADPETLADQLYDQGLNQQAFPAEPPFTLEDHERHSAVWKKMVAELEAMRDRLRLENDQHSNAVSTACRRERIALIKEILAWGEQPRANGPGDPDLGY